MCRRPFRYYAVVLLLLQCGRLTRARDDVAADLPTSSADFAAAFACTGPRDVRDAEAFARWVVAARHTTRPPGWEVARDAAPGDADRDYARVFDLLNWTRRQNALPVPVPLADICHKGMQTREADGSGGARPDEVPRTARWADLWRTCGKKLRSTARLSSSCMSMPGLLVVSPAPPATGNNPCRLKYRMVDGAHRICLRKYLLALLYSELSEMEESAKMEESDKTATEKISAQIEEKRRLIDQTSHGLFLVMNHTTFRSLLMNSDPHTSWAQSQERLMQVVTPELRAEWERWMRRVMERVADSDEEYRGRRCSHASDTCAEPGEAGKDTML